MILQNMMSKLEKIQKQQIAVQKVEQIEPHAVPFSSKVMLDRSEYENLQLRQRSFLSRSAMNPSCKRLWMQR